MWVLIVIVISDFNPQVQEIDFMDEYHCRQAQVWFNRVTHPNGRQGPGNQKAHCFYRGDVPRPGPGD